MEGTVIVPGIKKRNPEKERDQHESAATCQDEMVKAGLLEDPNRLLSVRVAAGFLGISYGSMSSLLRFKKIPYVNASKTGRGIRYGDLVNFCDENLVKSTFRPRTMTLSIEDDSLRDLLILNQQITVRKLMRFLVKSCSIRYGFAEMWEDGFKAGTNFNYMPYSKKRMELEQQIQKRARRLVKLMRQIEEKRLSANEAV